MKPSQLLLLPSLLALALASAGCISVDKTVTSDEPRTTVVFESDRAARLFYEALSRRPGTAGRTEEESSVNLIVISSRHKTVSGPNRAFNDAVAICDANKDGTITEIEATGFAQFAGVES